MVPKNLSEDKNFARQQVFSEILEKTGENAFFKCGYLMCENGPKKLSEDQNFARQQLFSEILEKTEENAFFKCSYLMCENGPKEWAKIKILQDSKYFMKFWRKLKKMHF